MSFCCVINKFNGDSKIETQLIEWVNGILLPKLFGPTVRKKCSSDKEKTFEIQG